MFPIVQPQSADWLDGCFSRWVIGQLSEPFYMLYCALATIVVNMESEISLSDVLDPALDSQNTLSVCTSTTTSSLLPPALQINGIDYEVVQRMKNKRGKTSWVWNKGYQLIKPPPGPNPEKKKPEINWLCRRCLLQTWSRGGRLGVALYSRIAIRVANSNIVPFWSVGRVVKAIHTARLRTLVPCRHTISCFGHSR